MSFGTPAISRRQWLTGWWSAPQERPPCVADEPADDRVAVIQGRHCLAYRNLMCSSCVENCPVEGAIQIEQGVPRVVAAVCTGCGDCHAVCPAPQNAVLMIALSHK